MSGLNAGRRDNKDGAVAVMMVQWLRLAATPAFAVMAFLTLGFDSPMPAALCSGNGHLGLSGMAPMYMLMAAFHASPWLKLIFRQRHWTLS